MLESTILVFIYVAFLEVLLYPLKERLKNSTSADESISIRRKIKWIRNISLFVFLFLYLVVGPIVAAKIANVEFIQHWLGGDTPALGCLIYNAWQALRQKENDNPLRPISCKRKADVLSAKKPFILYLRGFQNDNYNCKFYLEMQGKYGSFSEYNLVKELSDRISVYAVGMTKETYSPIGADRIYLDDSTWKSDVHELMITAEKIIILVDDKENCLWEIEQTKNFKNKTIFIINDYYKYLVAKIKLEGKFNLPQIDKQYHSVPFYMTISNNGYERLDIHRISSYVELANYTTNTLPNALPKASIYILRIGIVISFLAIGAFATLQSNDRSLNKDTNIIILKICMSVSMILYIVANWLMLRRKKTGLLISLFATFTIFILGFIRNDTAFFHLAGIIGLITIILLFLKSNGKTGFQILGITEKFKRRP